MSLMWTGVEVAVNFVEILLFLLLINSKFPKRFNGHVPFILTLVIGTVCMSYIVYYPIAWLPDYVLEPFIVALYTFFMRKGKPWRKLFWLSIGITLISTTAILGITVGLLLPGVTNEMILMQHSATRLNLLIFCKLLQTVLFFPLATRKDSARLTSIPIMLSLILVPATSFLSLLFLLEYGLKVPSSAMNQLLMMATSLSVLFINIVVFILYDSLSVQAENNLQMQVKLQQTEMLMHHSEEIAGLYEEMRGWRHDYHNHLQVIQGYLQLGKYDRLGEYVDKLESHISAQHMPLDCGNELIDALISMKASLAEKQNIKCDIRIHVPGRLRITDTDMCALLGNLVDNAIEACQRIESTEPAKFIDIKMHTIRGQLYIHLRNSTSEKTHQLGHTFVTRKAGRNHGIGLRHIDEIVSRYDGYISRCIENNIFETKIMIPL